MTFKKLTKKEWKNRERILAWLNGEEFKENSRSEPAVPDLRMGEILEFYVPPDVRGAAQFFTPAEMSSELLSYMRIPWYGGEGVSVLDPCAGIGHLLFPLMDTDCQLVAYELEEECVKIGKRLFPKFDWHWVIPFEHIDKLENQFDFVVMNPPFNTRRGMMPGERMVKGMCARSHDIFFVLAVRACKPGGQIGILAPYNYLDRMPKALKKWRDENVILEYEMGQMPGEFALSGIKVHGFLFNKPESEQEEFMTGTEEWGGPTMAGVIPVEDLGPTRQLSFL